METDRHFILTDEFKINEDGIKLFRIKCTKNFSEIHLGDLGGFIESYENLSGRAWVFHEAEVYGNARVFGDAWVTADAKVYGNAEIFGTAMVYGEAEIFGNAKVYGNAEIYDYTEVCGKARIYGDAKVCGNAKIFGSAWVAGHSIVCGDTEVCDNAEISGNVKLCSNVAISGNAELMKSSDYSCFQSFGSVGRTTIVFREKGNIIKINCGCFSGPVEEFEKRVEETHGDSKFGREYKAIINVIKIKFDLD